MVPKEAEPTELLRIIENLRLTAGYLPKLAIDLKQLARVFIRYLDYYDNNAWNTFLLIKYLQCKVASKT